MVVVQSRAAITRRAKVYELCTYNIVIHHLLDYDPVKVLTLGIYVFSIGYIDRARPICFPRAARANYTNYPTSYRKDLISTPVEIHDVIADCALDNLSKML